MGKIEERKLKNKQSILSAAKAIFLSEGYMLTSMDQVADRANMTKQSVYRYFPSKLDLFRAAIEDMGKNFDNSYLTHLDKKDSKQALIAFAKDFISFHLSADHIAAYRLLASESAKAPEIAQIFRSAGSDDIDQRLNKFFKERLSVLDPESLVRMWTAMLLAPRSGVIMGMGTPSKKEIKKNAEEATEFLLLAIR